MSKVLRFCLSKHWTLWRLSLICVVGSGLTAGASYMGYHRAAALLNIPFAVLGIFILSYGAELRYKSGYLDSYILWTNFKPSLRIRALSTFALIGMLASFGFAIFTNNLSLLFILYSMAISCGAAHILGCIDKVNVRTKHRKPLRPEDIVFLGLLNKHLHVEIKRGPDKTYADRFLKQTNEVNRE